ncbi:MAG: nitrate reductase molybdenum cofactor assembly chaperone [Nostocoides sp.]
MIWQRHRHTSPSMSPQALAATWQVTSLLLDYPDGSLPARRDMLQAVIETLPAEPARLLQVALSQLAGTETAQLQRAYVETFDITRRCALHLTYATHGDTRRRGVALVEFTQAYRQAGVELAGTTELPDHLCVVLEFGAAHNADIAWRLLTRHRVSIEVLRAALADRESPWLAVVDALRATLPPLEGDDHEALAKLIAQGPPEEEVGMEGYSLDPALLREPEPSGVLLGSDIPVGAGR